MKSLIKAVLVCTSALALSATNAPRLFATKRVTVGMLRCGTSIAQNLRYAYIPMIGGGLILRARSIGGVSTRAAATGAKVSGSSSRRRTLSRLRA